jgi:hypothetical protein
MSTVDFVAPSEVEIGEDPPGPNGVILEVTYGPASSALIFTQEMIEVGDPIANGTRTAHVAAILEDPTAYVASAETGGYGSIAGSDELVRWVSAVPAEYRLVPAGLPPLLHVFESGLLDARTPNGLRKPLPTWDHPLPPTRLGLADVSRQLAVNARRYFAFRRRVVEEDGPFRLGLPPLSTIRRARALCRTGHASGLIYDASAPSDFRSWLSAEGASAKPYTTPLRASQPMIEVTVIFEPVADLFVLIEYDEEQ